MDWTQAWTIIGVVTALFAGTVAIMISIFVHMDNKFLAIDNRIAIVIEAMHEESKSFDKKIAAIIEAMHQETKDFHGRLCAIEEKR